MYTSSLNLNAKAKFQNATVKMLALIPTYDKTAASKRLTKEDIKQREMEVHQGYKWSVGSRTEQVLPSWGEVDVLCPDGNVYSMNVIMLFMAMDHQATEQNCLKAANGCLFV